MNKKRKKETGRGGGFSDGNRAGGGFGNSRGSGFGDGNRARGGFSSSRGSGFGDGNRARGGFSSSRGGGFGDGNRAGGGFSSNRGGGFGDSNRNGLDNSFFGAHEPQKKDNPVEWAWHVAGSAAKSNISKVGNLLTDLYSWNQDGRDRENQENLSEAKVNLHRAERDLAAMESAPDKWDESSIQSQRYVVEDARRKYEAYAKVLHENVQKKTTQSSYKLFDQLAASASKDVRDAKRGQSVLVQKLTDMAAAAGEEAPDLFLVGLMGVSEAIPYLLRNFTEGSREARQKGGGTREQILHGAKQAGTALAADQLGKALQQIKSGNLLDDLPLNREGGLPRLGEPSMTPVDLGKFPLSKRKRPMEGHKDTDPHLLDFAQFQERYLSQVSQDMGDERMKFEYRRFLREMKPDSAGHELMSKKIALESGRKKEKSLKLDNDGQRVYNQLTNNFVKPRKEKVDGKTYYYDELGTVYRVDKDLQPNVEYRMNSYNYSTDEIGRVVSAGGELHRKNRKKRLKIKDAMDDIGKGFQKETDERGHLIADRFDGPNGMENLIPEDYALNHGDYLRFENMLDQHLKAGRNVTIDIRPQYVGNSRRPTEILVNYTVDGIGYKRNFSN